MKDAERQQQIATESPALGTGGRLLAQVLGGLKGAARDPLQWQMAVAGGGPGNAVTTAGRIGRTMLSEGLLNGGQELVLQAASQERKEKAGLQHGMGDMLANAGIAATFGALFGGSMQGGAELARIYKLGKGGEAVAARVIDGKPEPGDVEVLSKAMGIELGPDKLAMINRSFEERVLDDVMISPDASPDQVRVLEAAIRHAEDPDMHPPPDVVERMIADEKAGPARTMSADDYERIYGGDEDAIDDIRDTMFAETDASAARAVQVVDEPMQPRSAWDDFTSSRPDTFSVFEDADPITRARDLAEEARLASIELENSIFGEEAANRYRSLLRQERSSSNATADKAAAERSQMEANLTPEQEKALFNSPEETDPDYWRDVADTLSDFSTNDPKILGENLVLAARDFKPDIPWEKANQRQRMAALALQAVGSDAQRLGVPLDELLDRMEAAARKRYPDPDDAEFMIKAIRDDLTKAARGPAPAAEPVADIPALEYLSDPAEGQTIRPQSVAEPLDDAAMRQAETLAGDLVEPEVDVNGNPKNMLDYIPLEDGDGNVRLVSTLEALQLADEGNLLADLMESCKL